jgi:thiol:disulfide interchange protein
MQRAGLALLVLFATLVPAARAGDTASAADPPKLSARLLADHDSIRPGGEVALVMELTISAPWHMYDPIVLDTGLGTAITVDAPAGAAVGPWNFAAPRLGEQFGLEYLQHEGTFYALSTLRLAADAPCDRPIRLQAKVTGLACVEQCVPVNTETSLELPIRSDPAPAPANADVFAAARKQMPSALDQAEYLEGSRALVSARAIPVGGEGEVVVALKVRKQHHIQHRDPGTEDLIPTRIFVQDVSGITMKESEQVWPKPHVRDMPYIGKVNELNGDFVVRAPFRISDAKFEPRPLRLRVLVQYQTCSDKGQCYAPAMAVDYVDLEVTPTGSKPVANPDYDALKLPALASAGASTGSATGSEPPPTGGETAAAAESGEKTSPAAGSLAPPPLWWVFLLAFGGGMLLNVMPCVLPVISLKILSFARQSGDAPGRIFMLGLMYGAGILASFAVLAALLISTKSAWGGQMQNPLFVSILTAALFAFSLSLLGVFEIQLPSKLQMAAASTERREGPTGAFFNGVLATAVATPCTAPMLGSAVGSLIALPPAIAALGIMFVGVGLAFPYVLLTAFPQWLRFLPKPGPWMETFKQVVGFVTLSVVVWLLWTLSFLVDRGPLFSFVLTLVFVAMACWMLGHVRLTDDMPAVVRKWISAAAILGAGLWLSPRIIAVLAGEGVLGSPAGASQLVSTDAKSEWIEWRPGIGEELAREGNTVYIDYTAQWCLTCKANKATVLNTDAIRRKFDELNVVRVLADFTRYDEEMQKEINAHGRNGVPVNVIYPAEKPESPTLLPEILTQNIVLKALEQAGPSKGTPQTAAR